MSKDPVSPGEVARDLVVLFSRLRQRMREVSMEGLTPSQTSVLLRLVNGGESSTTRLADAEGVRPQSMTATLNALESSGLIVRRPDPSDGRRQIVSATETGRQRVTGGREERHEWVARAFEEQLSPAQLESISQSIALLDAAIARHDR